jgi:glycosyltransferase involved in cell wall biosynthesis
MKLFFVAADFGGSAWYRIIQAAGLSKEIYEDSVWSLAQRLDLRRLDEADFAVIQRQGSDRAIQTTSLLRKNGKIVISEMDDNLWSIPPAIGYLKKAWLQNDLRMLEKHLSISHAVTVSTSKLAKLVREYNKNVFVVPNLVVFDPAYEKPDFGKIRIGWAGSDTHMFDFTSDIQQALLDIKEKYRDRVDISMFGCCPPMLQFKTTFYSFQQPHVYLLHLRALGLDIGIAPALDNAFNESRSNVKYVEYSSCRAVTIANNIEPYRKSITHGKTGLLIGKNTKKAWYSAIQDLIENEIERRVMADRAYDYCYANYSVQEKKGQYSIYYEILNKVQGG